MFMNKADTNCPTTNGQPELPQRASSFTIEYVRNLTGPQWLGLGLTLERLKPLGTGLSRGETGSVPVSIG